MHKQNGIVLIAALIILIICSFIAVGVGQLTIRSKQDTTSQFIQLRSYIDAVAALNKASQLFTNALTNDTSKLTPEASGAIVTTFDTTNGWWRNSSKWQYNTIEFTDYSGNSSTKPRFRIEKREFVPNSLSATETYGVITYRVIARGGDSDNIDMIESYFTAPGENKE